MGNLGRKVGLPLFDQRKVIMIIMKIPCGMHLVAQTTTLTQWLEIPQKSHLGPQKIYVNFSWSKKVVKVVKNETYLGIFKDCACKTSLYHALQV